MSIFFLITGKMNLSNISHVIDFCKDLLECYASLYLFIAIKHFWLHGSTVKNLFIVVVEEKFLVNAKQKKVKMHLQWCEILNIKPKVNFLSFLSIILINSTLIKWIKNTIKIYLKSQGKWQTSGIFFLKQAYRLELWKINSYRVWNAPFNKNIGNSSRLSVFERKKIKFVITTVFIADFYDSI